MRDLERRPHTHSSRILQAASCRPPLPPHEYRTSSCSAATLARKFWSQPSLIESCFGNLALQNIKDQRIAINAFEQTVEYRSSPGPFRAVTGKSGHALRVFRRPFRIGKQLGPFGLVAHTYRRELFSLFKILQRTQRMMNIQLSRINWETTETFSRPNRSQSLESKDS